MTLQDFLDEACRIWDCPRPFRVPIWSLYAAAGLSEAFAMLFGTRAPLTRDFVRLGLVSHWGDTTRARAELLPELRYRSLREGLETL